MTYDLVLTFAPSLTGEMVCINLKSINDAMTNILSRKLNALNLRRNFSHGKLSDCVEAGGVYQISYGGVAKLMHCFDLCRVRFGFDFWVSYFSVSVYLGFQASAFGF